MTIDIKILGTGCLECTTLERKTHEVVEENAFEASVNNADNIMEIMAYDVISTPAMVINEKVVLKGYLTTKEEIKKKINGYLNG